jgi:hypothetical protein
MYVRGYLQGSENGRVVTIDHNTAQIQHCPISMTFHYLQGSENGRVVTIGIVVAILKMATGRQNGRHNNAKIKHCPISSKFDMWVDNDVPN